MPGFVSRCRPARAARDAEVQHLDEVRLAVARDEEDVLGLEIAVDDAGGVRGGQRAADLDRDLAGPVRVEAALVRQHVGEIDPVEVLHDEVGAAVVGRAEVHHVDDVGMADARGGARLAPEPLDQLLLRRVVRVQDLDRDDLADLDVLGGVHGPHAALADLAQHAVAVVDHAADEVDAQRFLLARERQPGHRRPRPGAARAAPRRDRAPPARSRGVRARCRGADSGGGVTAGRGAAAGDALQARAAAAWPRRAASRAPRALPWIAAS